LQEVTVDHSKVANFSDAFEAARVALASKGFRADDEMLVKQLKSAFGTEGLSGTAAPSLDRLRTRVGAGGKDEGVNLFEVAGQAAVPGTTALETTVVDKVSALKLLRHLYLGNLRGSQQLWIASIPKPYASWPHQELRTGTPQAAAVQAKANLVDERFTDDDRKNLGSAAQEALKWSLLAQAKVADFVGGVSGADGGTFVRRWFCDSTSNDDQVKDFAKRLSDGFKKIAAAANSGRLVFTDHPAYRGTAFERSEAFVTNGAKRDKFGVVYIESAFFGDRNVLKGLLNWTRIVVHELSHYEVGTADVPGHYGWQGIKPGTGFTPAQAITNAENWAFFAADVAGALTEGKRNEVLV
jgi:hypothetical protein